MPKTNPLGARLEELQAQVVAAKQRQRDCELEHLSAVAEIGRLRDAVIDAHAASDDALASKASAVRDAREGAARESEERVQGARRAVAKTEAELMAFAHQNGDGLLAERSGDAVAAAQGVEDAVTELVSAERQWMATAAAVAGVLRMTGRDTTLPQLPQSLNDLIRGARRAGDAQVPVPMPGGATAKSRRRTRA